MYLRETMECRRRQSLPSFSLRWWEDRLHSAIHNEGEHRM